MNINIETDINANIQKLDEFIKKLELAEDKSKMLTFITIEQFAQMRNCSISTAQKVFSSFSFPSENYGRSKVVELGALKEWYRQRHDKNDELIECSKNNPRGKSKC